MGVLTVATVFAVLAVGALVGAPFDLGRFALAGVVLFAFGCATAAVTSFLAVLTLRRGTAGGIAGGILIVMYLFNVVAQLQPGLGILADVSAFKYLSTTALIDTNASPLPAFAVFGVTALVGWLAAIVLFRRRDLLA